MLKIKFSRSQWQRLSEILGNLGLVYFASVVLPYSLDKPNHLNVFYGLILSISSWIVSLVVAKKSR